MIAQFPESPSHGSPPTIQVRQLQTSDVARWDSFVASCPEATFFHRAGWRQVLERAFGHDTYYLFAESDGRIEGILPLGHLRSRLFGNALVSVPFCVYGGVAAASDAARAVLTLAARELAERLNVDYLEMRNLAPQHADWMTKDLYVTFRKSLDPDPEKNLLAIPRKQRAMVRKGIEAGLQGALDDNIGRFYDAYADSVRRLGTPVFSRKYFQTLRDVFGQDCEVLTITRNGHVVSSVMSFYFRDEVLPYYGGGTREAREVAGNDFMYWELMRRACERGVRVFDYGRSKKGTGPYSFKKNWGFEPQPLHYEYLLVKAKTLPDVNPLNPKYHLFIETWKRLPLTVTKFLGPMISRSLG
jgi:FemAB-related protein (PEP-CTERM system-associated)